MSEAALTSGSSLLSPLVPFSPSPLHYRSKCPTNFKEHLCEDGSRLSSRTIFPMILSFVEPRGIKKREKEEKRTRKIEKEGSEKGREKEGGRIILGSSNLWTGLFIAPVGAGFTRSPITEIYDPPLHPALPLALSSRFSVSYEPDRVPTESRSNVLKPIRLRLGHDRLGSTPYSRKELTPIN